MLTLRVLWLGSNSVKTLIASGTTSPPVEQVLDLGWVARRLGMDAIAWKPNQQFQHRGKSNEMF